MFEEVVLFVFFFKIGIIKVNGKLFLVFFSKVNYDKRFLFFERLCEFFLREGRRVFKGYIILRFGVIRSC